MFNKNEDYDTYSQDYFEYVFLADILVNCFVSHKSEYKWQTYWKSAKYYAK